MSCCLFQKVLWKKIETDFTLLKENTNFESDLGSIPIAICDGSVLVKQNKFGLYPDNYRDW